MNKRKKIWTAALAAIMALAVSVTAFAALSDTFAREIAEKWVPNGAEYVMTRDHDNEFKVKFFDRSTNTSYEVEVSKWTESVSEIKTERVNDHGSANIRLNEADIKDIVLNEYPNAAITKIKLDRDDGFYKYEVKFHTNSVRGEMEINPETGAIIERDLDY